MKKLVALTIMAFVSGIALSAQEVNEAQKQKEKQNQVQTQDQKEKQDTHGQTVSQVAKETPSGPGKGQTVSAVAKSKNEGKKDGKKAKKEKKLKDPNGLKPGIEANENEQGARNPRGSARPVTAGRDAAKGTAGPAGQGKK